jgi:hypothetical protein
MNLLANHLSVVALDTSMLLLIVSIRKSAHIQAYCYMHLEDPFLIIDGCTAVTDGLLLSMALNNISFVTLFPWVVYNSVVVTCL